MIAQPTMHLTSVVDVDTETLEPVFAFVVRTTFPEHLHVALTWLVVDWLRELYGRAVISDYEFCQGVNAHTIYQAETLPLHEQQPVLQRVNAALRRERLAMRARLN